MICPVKTRNNTESQNRLPLSLTVIRVMISPTKKKKKMREKGMAQTMQLATEREHISTIIRKDTPLLGGALLLLA